MKRLLLIGAGHAHAEVLRQWAQAPVQGVDLCVASPHAQAPYSGMVPGWLAGRYLLKDIQIDFAELTAAAGGRLIEAELQAIGPDARHASLSDGSVQPFDVVSINVGSTLRPPVLEPRAGGVPTTLLSMRPIASLARQYQELLTQWIESDPGVNPARPTRLTAVGGGAAGFESLLAVHERLRHTRPDKPLKARLLSRGSQLLPGFSPAAQRHAAAILKNCGIELILKSDAHRLLSSARQGHPNEDWASEIVLWATGAQAHDWQLDPQRRGPLAVSPDGFIRIGPTLQSRSHGHVFAVGDCAHWEASDLCASDGLPKAGVYAVRMGPILAHNLRAVFNGNALQSYRPQPRALALLATGQDQAIASWGTWGIGGQTPLLGTIAWKWKDYIDQRFIHRYRF